MSKMLLTQLNLRQDYLDPTKLVGSVTFAGERGEVKIQVNQDRASRILEIVAEEIVAASQDVARMMTSTIIEQVKQPAIETVESKSNPSIFDKDDDVGF